MKTKRQICIVFINLLLVLFIFQGCKIRETTAQPESGLQMNITGEIAKGRNDVYIIRGKVPMEIFTILNPKPEKLDELIDSGKVVDLKVRSISGDNVKIEMIDSEKY